MKNQGLLVCLLAGLFTVVLATRWAFIARYGTDLPEWDMWDAEGVKVLWPFYQGQPLLPGLLAPHNEHYPVLTKLLNLSLTLANGAWDQRLVCVVNALLPALLAAALLGWSRGFAPEHLLPLLGLVLAAAWAPPLAWHNVITGFHSSQFFLILLSLAAIALLPFAQSWSLRWCLGAAATLLSLLTMASGIFTAATVVALIVYRLILRETRPRNIWPAFAIASLTCLVAWLTRHEVDYHLPLRAKTFSDFALTVLQSLHWPARASGWFALLIWLPWFWLAGILLRNARRRADVHGHILLGLGLWIWLQLLATGYARGAGAPAPASRYVDTLVFGCCINALSIAWLWQHRGPGVLSRYLLPAATLSWACVFFTGIADTVRHALENDLFYVRAEQDAAQASTRGYLATRNRAYLVEPLPYPGVESFAQRIDLPELSRLMPASVRPSVKLQAATGSTGFTQPEFGYKPLIPGADFTPVPYRWMWTSVPGTEPAPKVIEWRSAPVALPHRSGRLVFEVPGSIPTASLILELRAASTDELLSRATFLRTVRGPSHWAAAPIPAEPFVVRAIHDRSRFSPPAGFAEPVIMPTGSYIAWRLATWGDALAIAGGAVLLGSVLGAYIRRIPVWKKAA